MRVAFVGKGGSGKSSIVGTFARLLDASGDQVLEAAWP
jgi:CO dehydrogenase nickel-insertion accessory protein CooC1